MNSRQNGGDSSSYGNAAGSAQFPHGETGLCGNFFAGTGGGHRFGDSGIGIGSQKHLFRGPGFHSPLDLLGTHDSGTR